MKNRFFIALPMAFSLMVPAALAQPANGCAGKQDNGNQFCLQLVADQAAQTEPASAAPQSSSSQSTQASQPGDAAGILGAPESVRTQKIRAEPALAHSQPGQRAG
jgi:hypothetical protein